MGIISTLRAKLSDPRLEGVDVDSTELVDVNLSILVEKPMIKEVFKEFYDLCIGLNKKLLNGKGLEIEVGAGASFFKQVYPHIISTDIKASSHHDRILDIQNMNLESQSVRGFYAINCFHHLPEPRKFFSELKRTLVPGGGIVLIEPYYGWAAHLLYAYIHKEEHFNSKQKAWESIRDPRYVMSDANQALSYLIFIRDRKQFEEEFPELEIVYQATINNYLRYLLSGGVSFRQLVPNKMIRMLKWVEYLLKPFERFIALHYVIVLRRKTN
ncbi:MAG: hypothetical protein A3E87_04990 [Gammaproteobacteria bacterium RIFCSPHIGHO2_12_FULL_35_23]|nr:MAG: hypothetical protein A3E87_04990 [Gammaproteobacteria bacterium RIFCSPHIGHO2_12_FULL_35_23]